MAYSAKHVAAAFLAGVALATSAGEPNVNHDAIEVSLGETAYLQLTSNTPTVTPIAAVRVQDPKRDYLVIKVTFEAGDTGTRHNLVVRNGYDQSVFFATECQQSTTSDRSDHVRKGVPPGVEVRMEIPPSTTKISLCDFTLAFPPIR